MPKEWAKIYRNAPLSEHLAALFDSNPAALAMFWPLKALADDFGRYTANPRKFAHNVGGLCGISAQVAAQMIADMAAAGVIELYEVDGDPYLQIAAYHNHEEPKWYYVGKAEWPAPLGWEPPESLVAFLRENKTERNVTLKRYGITPATSEACDALIAELEPPPNSSPTPLEPEPNHTSTTVEPQLNCTPTVPCQPDVDVDVDGDVDVDVDNDNVKGKGNDSLPESPQLPLDELEPEEPEEPKQPKPDRATTQQMFDTLREPLSDEDLGLIDEYIALLAAKNKSGEMTLPGQLNRMRELLEIRDGNGQTVGVGVDPWRYGMNAANKAGIPNPKYVRTASSSWQPKSYAGSQASQRTGPTRVSESFVPVYRDDGSEVF